MAAPRVVVLHPGEMGTAVAATLAAGGAQVGWVSDGRGAASRARASAAGLLELVRLPDAVSWADVVVSVCPPAVSEKVASEVAGEGFSGIYLDANAVAPATVRRISARVTEPGASFVDGGIIGPPPVAPDTTRLYLAGEQAGPVAALFAAGPLEAVVVPGPPGAASALKACYAAWTKGSAAMLLAVRCLAVREGVDAALVEEWRRSQPDLPDRCQEAARTNAPKAWRFAGEMDEQAAAFAAAGLPDGFARAAAEIYRRLDGFRGASTDVSLPEVLAALDPGSGHRLVGPGRNPVRRSW